MLKGLFFMSAVFLLAGASAQSSQHDVRLGGKVYMSYSVPTSQSAAQSTSLRLSKRYIADFKVIAIKKTAATNVSDIKAHKKNFCANDRSFFNRYHAMVAYSNSDGYFEFRGLVQQSSYILIFCDRDIQLSEAATMNRSATYSIGEKLIKF
jgi:hypothetical protein